MEHGKGPWLAVLGLIVLAVGAAPAQANCSGYVCESICQTGVCGEPHCALSAWGGQCECEVKVRERYGFDVVVCKTFGGDCSLGCYGGGLPVPFNGEEDPGAGRPFPLRPTAEMEAALAGHPDVLLVLESLRGPGGVPAGEAEMKVTLSRALPQELLPDGTQAFEPPVTAAMWLQAAGGHLLFEMVFEEQGLTASGEIRRGGDTGIVELLSADGTLADRIAW